MTQDFNFPQWWQAREPREKWLLGVMSMMIAAFVYWYALLTPLRGVLTQAQLGYDQAAADIIQVRGQARDINARLAYQAEHPLTPGALVESARSAGIPVSRTSDSAGALMVDIEGVQSPALFSWLAAIRDTYRISPTTLRIEATEGALSASISMPVSDRVDSAPVTKDGQ